MNRVTLVGRIGQPIDLKYTPSGVAVANITIAVNGRKNAQGEREVTWVPVVLWRQSAEFAANYLAKGRLVSIDGRLHQRSWVAQDGTRKNVLEVVCDQIQPLDKDPNRRNEDRSPDSYPANEEVEFEDPFADY